MAVPVDGVIELDDRSHRTAVHSSGTDEPLASPKDSKHQENAISSTGTGGLARLFTLGNRIDYALQALAIVAALGSGVSVALVNVVLGGFVDVLSGVDPAAQGSKFMGEVAKYSLYFVYIGIARLVLTYMYSSLFTLIALRLTVTLRKRFLRAALSQELNFYDTGSAGSISTQATTNGRLIETGVGEKLGQCFQTVATFIAAFIIAFMSKWKLTLILICIVPTLIITMGAIGVIDSKLEGSIMQVNGQAGSFAENVLGSMRAIQALNLRPRLIREYATYTQRARDLGAKKNPVYGAMFGCQFFVIYSGMGLAFWKGIAMVSRGEVDGLGTVLTVLLSVIIAASSISTLAPQITAFSRAATAATELFALIDRKSASDPFDEEGERPAEPIGAIDLQGVSFAYPTRPDILTLDNFTLSVPAGKVTALVWPSGSGKSTIIGLIERWYNPASGKIKLDGVSIGDLNLRWLRTNIRLVQQEPVLFNETVFQNIANGLVGTRWEFASKAEKLERVMAAAKTAFADDFIAKLPDGYDTCVGERGRLLSGGQKQRIAIARSIVSEPKILLLDEATSALDPNAERTVQKALDRAVRNRTTIVIAHKLKTIQDADNIVVISNGKIFEQGRHDELVARSGMYSRLVKAQDLSAEAKDPAINILGDSNDEPEGDELKEAHSLKRHQTCEAREFADQEERDSFSRYEQTGIVRTIMKLVAETPNLRGWYIATLVSSVLGAAVFPGQALLLADILDLASSSDIIRRGNFMALMLFVMAIGCFSVYFVMGYSTNVIAQTFNQKLRNDILDAFLRQDQRFFDRPENTVGALCSRLSSYPLAVFVLMGFNMGMISVAIINIIASSILSIIVSWKLGLVGVFAGIPPMVLSGYVRIRFQTKMDQRAEERFSQSASIASESLMAMRTVSSLAIEEAVLDRYANELDAAIARLEGPVFHMMSWFAFTQSIEHFVLALGFWWGSRLMSQGEMTFHQFFVSFMSVYSSGQSGAQFFSYLISLTEATTAGNYYFWLLGLKPTICETTQNRDIGPKAGCREYDFEKVQFTYPLAPDRRILKGISIKIKPGQFVAFVGASGCGKSTMISLLERFYDPSSGIITIDGSDALSDLNPWLYRGRLALVLQEATLFQGSIRENVAMGLEPLDVSTEGPKSDLAGGSQPEAPDALIERALRAANMWNFVSSLPEGLATSCGNSGIQLSGGQRQRIAIARALVRDPNVLLLDEATSALDTESERAVQAALREASSAKDRITITVAHRLSTVREADCIFVFYRGQIIEAGSHDQLVVSGGMYKRMCDAQSLDRSE